MLNIRNPENKHKVANLSKPRLLNSQTTSLKVPQLIRFINFKYSILRQYYKNITNMELNLSFGKFKLNVTLTARLLKFEKLT